MISLVITACLAAHPHVCRNFESKVEAVNEIQCIRESQMLVAQPGGWKDQHPDWQVRKIKCAPPKKGEIDL